MKDGFKSDDILTNENGSKNGLLKSHFPYGYHKFNGLGSPCKNMTHEYAKLITNDVFHCLLLKGSLKPKELFRVVTSGR